MTDILLKVTSSVDGVTTTMNAAMATLNDDITSLKGTIDTLQGQVLKTVAKNSLQSFFFSYVAYSIHMGATYYYILLA